jgi:hypothetical protein
MADIGGRLKSAITGLMRRSKTASSVKSSTLMAPKRDRETALTDF